MNSFLVVFVAFLAAACVVLPCKVLDEEWEAFKMKYEKQYESEIEEKNRKGIFKENKIKVSRHNQAYERGESTFKLGVNAFSDLLLNEFVNRMGGSSTEDVIQLKSNSKDQRGSMFFEPFNYTRPSSFDWRNYKAVTEVKNQGYTCGSCWAFSATGALEGFFARKYGKLVSLSEQNLLDCTAGELYGNVGCSGGFTANTFLYVANNGGIDTEASYQYEGIQQSCRYDPNSSAGSISGVGFIQSGDENALTTAVAKLGPISVLIDGSHDSFKQYKGGLYYEPNCTKFFYSGHRMLVVGYGTLDNVTDFYIIKNSFGTDWGDDGYMTMVRNHDNHCGIARYATYPLL